MSINLALYGQTVSILMLIMAPLCYYLGRKKTTTPLLVASLGVVSALFPPLALVYLAALSLKSDLPVSSKTQEGDQHIQSHTEPS